MAGGVLLAHRRRRIAKPATKAGRERAVATGRPRRGQMQPAALKAVSMWLIMSWPCMMKKPASRKRHSVSIANGDQYEIPNNV